ncbi:MAG: aldehyde dehydrogenase family protein [Vulcanisaeta sp.]
MPSVSYGKYTIEIPVRVKLFIDGEEVSSSKGRTFTRENPANFEQTIAVVEEASTDDLNRAVDLAREVFDKDKYGWVTNYRQRIRILFKTAEILREEAERIAVTVALENGMPIRQAKAHVMAAAEVFEFYAGLGDKIYGDSIVLSNGNVSLIFKEPVGVVAAVSPWNFPMTQAARKIAPALAAGCTVVWKPASYTPMSAMEIYRALAKAGLPKGVVNVVYGPGATVGNELVRHPKIDYVSFTGETTTGKLIMQQAAAGIKRVGLELGGKNPGIVFDDANIEEAVRSIVFGGLRNTGQACGAISRVLVHESVHDKLVNRLVEVSKSLLIGDPLKDDTDMGPLVSKAQEEKVLGYIDFGKKAGFKVALDGGKLSGGIYDKGYFVSPVIFDNVDPKSRLAQEEIFGPVIAVIPFKTEQEAIEIANNVIYGLTASIFTKDPAKALRVARKLQAGTVWINDAYTQPAEGIWGGYKQSGIGRELGLYGLEEFLEIKQVYVDTTGSLDRPHWRTVMKIDKL